MIFTFLIHYDMLLDTFLFLSYRLCNDVMVMSPLTKH